MALAAAMVSTSAATRNTSLPGTTTYISSSPISV